MIAVASAQKGHDETGVDEHASGLRPRHSASISATSSPGNLTVSVFMAPRV